MYSVGEQLQTTRRCFSNLFLEQLHTHKRHLHIQYMWHTGEYPISHGAGKPHSWHCWQQVLAPPTVPPVATAQCGGGGSLTTQQQENTRKSQKCHANGLSNPCYPKLNSQHWDIQNNIVTINILFEKRRRWGALNPLYQEVPPIPALIWVQPRWHRINHILLHVVCHCRSSLAIVGHHW